MAEKILITDESVSMRQMTGIILNEAGYEVIEARDGVEAIRNLFRPGDPRRIGRSIGAYSHTDNRVGTGKNR